jgi:uncharacterized membrane protein YuzA (DUF378 family)
MINTTIEIVPKKIVNSICLYYLLIGFFVYDVVCIVFGLNYFAYYKELFKV